jgi:hypothetical protein
MQLSISNSSSSILLVLEEDMSQNFVILSESTKEYKRFNAVGTQLTVQLAPPTDHSNPVRHF